jgi:E3 ubiquitin-protein ligase MYCBP2
VSKYGFHNLIEILLQLEGSGMVGNWLFREVLERLLDLVTVPVKQALCQEKTTHSSELVQNCCHLLARIVAELASQSSGSDVSG